MPIIDSTTRESSGFFHSLGKVLTSKDAKPGEELYKSAHNVVSHEIWTSTLNYANSFASASSYATGSPVLQVGTPSNPAYLYPLTKSNFQSWFLDTGAPKWYPDGFEPSTGWCKPLINPSDVPNSAGAPSNGYTIQLFRRDGVNPISYGNSRYDVDYYSGLIKFEYLSTPIDSGAPGLFFVFDPSGLLGGTSSAMSWLQSPTTGGPRAIAFKYTGQYLQNIAENPAVLSEAEDVDLTPLDVLSGTGTASLTPIGVNPVGEVVVFVNGQRQDLGYATTSQCFFGTQSTTAKSANDIALGDYLFWNADATNSFPLTTSDKLTLYYQRPS